MAGLQFRFEELIREARELKNIAKSFLDSGASLAFDEFISALESIKGAGEGHPRRVELGELRTKESYSHDRRTGLGVRMCVKGVWDLSPLGRTGAGRKVEFSGIASTRIALQDATDPCRRLATWKIELGDHQSPGCYFHIHVPGENHDPPFLAGLPVPRLPSLFATPMAALEFALGELFQKKWDKELGRSDPRTIWWCSTQKRRLCDLLEWQQRELKKYKEYESSPWMTLKAAKPPADLFLR